MRAVVQNLQLTPGHDLDRLLDYAAQIHKLRRKKEEVSRSTLLYAALRVEPLVRAVLETNGLQIKTFESHLGLRTSPELSRGGKPDFTVNDLTGGALYAYHERWPSRPLDALGVAAAILLTRSEGVDNHLEASRLDGDEAARRLAELVEASPAEGLIRAEKSGFLFSGLAQFILTVAGRMIIERNIAWPPLTTSAVAIALVDGESADPTAPSFLRKYVFETSGEERWRKAVDEWMGTYDRGRDTIVVDSFTQPLTAVFERARQIARTATRVDEISARHLVGAFIALARHEDFGSSDFLDLAGIDADALAVAYLHWLQQNAPPTEGDLIPVWRRFLGLPDAAFLARFDAEQSAGEDWLEIDDHVQAFATMIASDAITPPLAVGLFGDWGSGKSFFMAKLREAVNERARRAQAADAGEKSPYHGRIVQIEFNAWHYVESNLWASLVENVFSNLKLAGEDKDKIARRRAEVAKQIDERMADRAAAEEKVQKAEVARTQAANALEAKQKLAETSAVGLGGLRAVDVWDLVEIDDQTRADLQTLFGKLGVGRVSATKDEIRRTMESLQSVTGRAAVIRSWIMRRPMTIFGLLVILLLTPFAVKALNTLALDLNPLLVQILTPIASIIGWIGVRLAHVSSIFSRIDRAREAIDVKMQERDRERQSQIDEADKRLRDAVKNVEAAETELERKDKAVAEAQEELIELSRGRRLARFISERAESDDYRRLLGVLATVRNDFSTLSELMQPEEGESPIPNEFRIDRIVLYIDDLDRCHPERVVEVLQAVHLLLAFKLFVVVVGVDARWVAESLRQKHRALQERTTGAQETVDVMGFAAKPHDYLEKIFQVPFWLEPLSVETTAGYIGNLVAKDVAIAASDGASEKIPLRGTADPHAITPERTTAVPRVRKRSQPKRDLNPQELKIQKIERDFMQSAPIAKLVSRSPRTAKRFVNTYRFMRASIAPGDLPQYLSGHGIAPYEAVLMLLAIVVGAPDVSLEVFDEMKKKEHESLKVEKFVHLLAPTYADHDERDEWDRVAAALSARGEAPVGRLQEHIDDVARYSFRAPYRELAERKAKKRDPIAIRIVPRDQQKGGPSPGRPDH
ncbi:MAG TPA: P-loop NTPase fold protein [Thermoanaerobaculia bacterium]